MRQALEKGMNDYRMRERSLNVLQNTIFYITDLFKIERCFYEGIIFILTSLLCRKKSHRANWGIGYDIQQDVQYVLTPVGC